jgi:hypothetical protein
MTFANLQRVRSLLVAATLLAGGIGIGAATLRRAGAASAPPPPPPAAPAKAQFTGTLKSGVSVELLGVIKGKAIDDWWLPDGTPDYEPVLRKVRFERTRNIAPPGEERRDHVGVVVRFNLKLRDGSLATSTSEPWFSTALDADDKPIGDLVVLYNIRKLGGKSEHVRFEFATGPWGRTDVRADAAELGQTRGDVHFREAETLRGGTYIGLDVQNERWAQIAGPGAHRLCARDADGKVRVAIPFQGLGKEPPAPTEFGFLFADTEPADLKTFWLERRPANEWIEFRNVATEPAVETQVRVVTSDDVVPKSPVVPEDRR